MQHCTRYKSTSFNLDNLNGQHKSFKNRYIPHDSEKNIKDAKIRDTYKLVREYVLEDIWNKFFTKNFLPLFVKMSHKDLNTNPPHRKESPWQLLEV